MGVLGSWKVNSQIARNASPGRWAAAFSGGKVKNKERVIT
jgi:hypothetical protein